MVAINMIALHERAIVALDVIQRVARQLIVGRSRGDEAALVCRSVGALYGMVPP